MSIIAILLHRQTQPVRFARWGVAMLAVLLVGADGARAASESVLRASDAALYDALGTSVSVSGDYAVLGAPNDSTASAVNVGSAYVFRKAGSSWVQEQKLVASDGDEYDKFGSCVSIDGNVVAVGAAYDRDRGTNSGSVYVFHRNDNGTPGDPTDDRWVQRQKLVLADGAEFDYFGAAVAVSGTMILVGASEGDASFSYGNGAAYIYRFNGTSWTLEAILRASDGALGDRFGAAVALHGNVALVGAYLDRDSVYGTGSAYVFQRIGSTWTQTQKFLPAGRVPYTQFGTSVALYGELAVIGDPFDDDRGDNFGSATIYRFNGSSWAREVELYGSDATTNERFGAAVTAGTDEVIVGAYNEGSSGALSMDGYGAAYRFGTNGGSWIEEEKLVASARTRLDLYGQSVGLADNNAVIGVPGYSRDIYRAGAAVAYGSGCLVNTDCDDANPCTTDSCVSGTCSYASNTNSCNDGDACTTGDRCSLGSCRGTQIDCADGVSCTVDSCVSGTCRHDDTNCECTVNLDCNDGNQCTTDTCASGACTYVNNSNYCNDGDACTTADRCFGGACSGAPIDCADGVTCTVDYCVSGTCQHDDANCECAVNLDCNDGNPCTTDTCASGACSNVFNSNYCNDGNACTTGDRCSLGSCRGTPIDCDDGVNCTVDSCVSGTCRHDDANCECAVNLDCNDENLCTTDTCISGACTHVYNSNSCNDGNACTTGDRCSGGVCSGTPFECDDGIPCTLDHCLSGTCVHDDSTCECAVDGECDDGNACTADRCLLGSCQNPPILECCGNGTCEPGEDSCGCPEDCESRCGNGICEVANAENCLTCPSDCNGEQGGQPDLRFCCGDGAGRNPVDCTDPRCWGGGVSCAGACCGDGYCDLGENGCNCPGDCGRPASVERPDLTCGDQVDNDCDGSSDCDDPDCAADRSCPGRRLRLVEPKQP